MNFLYHFWLSKEGLVLSVTPVIKLLIASIFAVGLVYILDDDILLALIVFPMFVGSSLLLVPTLRTDIKLMLNKGLTQLNARQSGAHSREAEIE